jgi:hypothetical protein
VVREMGSDATVRPGQLTHACDDSILLDASNQLARRIAKRLYAANAHGENPMLARTLVWLWTSDSVWSDEQSWWYVATIKRHDRT